MPPLIPAAKLRPVRPITTTRPAVMLAAVIAHAFDHRNRAAVADREALAGDAAHVGLAAGGAVEHTLPTITFSWDANGDWRGG